ncbi:ribonuclease III [candidate division TA06 bacterium]|uniref:Ribonuclease 3 n=1 Tax=candidate division TA06 bacterium TaxID=2250710 RepID=A0A933MI72_UNCT6|nr:ribonuclease III [candidate division TA06 bacterium]
MLKKIFFRPGQKALLPERQQALGKIRERLGWKIKNRQYFLQALKHRSVAGRHIDSNERLELLGDSVLGLLVCEYLYITRPKDDEGQLTEVRSLVVSKKILAKLAKELGVGELLEMSREEVASGGRYKDSILCDAMESLIAAYYLDSGLKAVRIFLQKTLFWQITHLSSHEAYKNFKGLLQEYMQSRRDARSVRYNVKADAGPEHHRTFEVELKIARKRYGLARAGTKKEAEQLAAQQTLEKLKTEIG